MLPELERTEEILHAAAIDKVERRILDLAMEQTATDSGAIFLWDADAEELHLDFYVSGGLEVPLPHRALRRRVDGRPNGIAFHVAESNTSWLCHETADDPHYARYFAEVRSLLAVPIPYQRRAVGVISVSAAEPGRFTTEHQRHLEALARASAHFLRRAQLYRRERDLGNRPPLIKGLSPAWSQIELLIERVSPTSAPVLVRGESGTGKELVCRAIHFNSRRATGPFVSINCAAIPETLLESTLFGHVRGAFTGAEYAKVGELEKAQGGTLFLDEIGELTPPLQAKILRALEAGEVQPIGSNDPPRRVDARILAATNQDLEQMRRDGRFRDDLYYRLAVITIRTPPLRTYLHNLPVLAQVMVTQANARYGTQVHGLSADALALLSQHDFPGNVRELRNLIERAAIVTEGPWIEPRDLPELVERPVASPAPPPAERPSLAEHRRRWVAEAERTYLSRLLDELGGEVDAVAEVCRVDRTTAYRLLKKHGLRAGRRWGPRDP